MKINLHLLFRKGSDFAWGWARVCTAWRAGGGGSLETTGWNSSDNGGELEEETKQGGGHSEKGSVKSNSVPPFFYIPFPIEATVLRF